MRAFQHIIVEKPASLKLRYDERGVLHVEVADRHPVFGEHIHIEIKDLDRIVLEE